MSLPVASIAALQDLDYSEFEARFLYLVATHPGYFTRRQFLSFAAKSKGWSAHQFTSKLLERRHARRAKTPPGFGGRSRPGGRGQRCSAC